VGRCENRDKNRVRCPRTASHFIHNAPFCCICFDEKVKAENAQLVKIIMIEREVKELRHSDYIKIDRDRRKQMAETLGMDCPDEEK
jgi:hypothetical protein